MRRCTGHHPPLTLIHQRPHDIKEPRERLRRDLHAYTLARASNRAVDPKDLTETINKFGPPTTAKTFQGPIQSVTANRGTAGVLLVVGVVGALWTASGYVGGFFRASNVIYEVEEGRPFFKLRPLQMLVTLLQVLLLAVVALAGWSPGR